MKQKVSEEFLEKIMQAQSVEDSMALAREAGAELTEEEAAMFLDSKEAGGISEISDEELDNVTGGSKCRGGRFYSSDPPNRLIVTMGNTCSLWQKNPAFDDGCRQTCVRCTHFEKESWRLTCYCKKRTYDNDPLN